MQHINNFGNFAVSRIEAFSDAVFEIVVTLLLFNLKFTHIAAPTNQNVWAGIVATLPGIISWINSFLVVCVIWMNHHRVMGTLKRIDNAVFWLNNLLLMSTSLLPFPTQLLAEYPGISTAVFFYGICLSLPSFAFSLLGWYTIKKTTFLKDEFNQPAIRKIIMNYIRFGPLAYLLASLLSWVSPWLAITLYTLISICFIFPRIYNIQRQ